MVISLALVLPRVSIEMQRQEETNVKKKKAMENVDLSQELKKEYS